METIQLTSNLEDKLDELIIIFRGIENQLKEINKDLNQLNKNFVAVAKDYENKY